MKALADILVGIAVRELQAAQGTSGNTRKPTTKVPEPCRSGRKQDIAQGGAQ
jgi:hypothetical protein